MQYPTVNTSPPLLEQASLLYIQVIPSYLIPSAKNASSLTCSCLVVELEVLPENLAHLLFSNEKCRPRRADSVVQYPSIGNFGNVSIICDRESWSFNASIIHASQTVYSNHNVPFIFAYPKLRSAQGVLTSP